MFSIVNETYTTDDDGHEVEVVRITGIEKAERLLYMAGSDFDFYTILKCVVCALDIQRANKEHLLPQVKIEHVN